MKPLIFVLIILTNTYYHADFKQSIIHQDDFVSYEDCVFENADITLLKGATFNRCYFSRSYILSLKEPSFFQCHFDDSTKLVTESGKLVIYNDQFRSTE